MRFLLWMREYLVSIMPLRKIIMEISNRIQCVSYYGYLVIGHSKRSIADIQKNTVTNSTNETGEDLTGLVTVVDGRLKYVLFSVTIQISDRQPHSVLKNVMKRKESGLNIFTGKK